MIKEIRLRAGQIDDTLSRGDLLRLVALSEAKADAMATASWRDATGERWVTKTLSCYIVQVGSRAILWTRDGRGSRGDREVEDFYGDAQYQVRMYAENVRPPCVM